ncbi:MAG: 2TM domain-containing protein [Solirubrobacterales bacterium]
MEASGDLRDQAIKNLKAKQAFRYQVVIWAGVSIFLILIWAISDRGFFWPIFPIAAWGLFGLIPQGWRLYHGDNMNEDQIQKEMDRIGNDPPGGTG